MSFGNSPPDRDELIEKFNRDLQSAIEHGRLGGKPTGLWWDMKTLQALDRVAAVIDEARAEFAKQLDGTHIAEDGAQFAAEWCSFYPDWQQTPFAESVKAAYEHVIAFINGPRLREELDLARAELASAEEHWTRDPNKALIVEQLRFTLDELEVSDDAPNEDDKHFARFTARALRDLINSSEEPDDTDLDRSSQLLDATHSLRSRSSLTAQDRGIFVKHLRLILEGLQGLTGRAHTAHCMAESDQLGNPSQLDHFIDSEYEFVHSSEETGAAAGFGMNDIQRKALSSLCSQYGVEFRETDYFVYPETSSMMAGWAEGWIGGNYGRKLYVSCDPKTGRIHS